MKQAIVIVVAGGLVVLALYVMVVGMKAESVPTTADTLVENVVPLPTLEGKKWQWVETIGAEGEAIVPVSADVFSLQFEGESVRISTDCNTGVATYTITYRQLTFGSIGSTKKYCEGAQEQSFFAMLSTVAAYHISDAGQLILYRSFDAGSIIFE